MAIWLEESMASTFSCQRKPKDEKKIFMQLSPISSSISVPQNSSNGYLNVVFALSKAWMCLFITSFPYKHNLQKEVHLYNLGATR